jgi:hypothetical protein
MFVIDNAQWRNEKLPDWLVLNDDGSRNSHMLTEKKVL